MESIVHSLTEEPVAASMTSFDIVRSWKDPRYRRNLSFQQMQTLPQHPAGSATLTDQELKAASGLMLEEDEFTAITTSIFCTTTTFNHWKSCGCP
jgi:mersacidin/lichenicidin family type 2 lantibiotic